MISICVFGRSLQPENDLAAQSEESIAFHCLASRMRITALAASTVSLCVKKLALPFNGVERRIDAYIVSSFIYKGNLKFRAFPQYRTFRPSARFMPVMFRFVQRCCPYLKGEQYYTDAILG
jgi:hypothetical protein